MIIVAWQASFQSILQRHKMHNLRCLCDFMLICCAAVWECFKTFLRSLKSAHFYEPSRATKRAEKSVIVLPAFLKILQLERNTLSNKLTIWRKKKLQEQLMNTQQYNTITVNQTNFNYGFLRFHHLYNLYMSFCFSW